MQAIAHADATTEKRVARPLSVLVPLIQDDLAHAKDAAKRAGMPYYHAVGEKLLEARPQFDAYDAFIDWAKRNFDIGRDAVSIYTRLASHSGAPEFKSQSEFIRSTTTQKNYNRPSPITQQVNRIVSRVDTETLNLAREEMKRADERDAQRKLGLQLIDIGYKVLARTLHPDKGGSREAMARLNAVRDRLKATF